MKAWLGLLRTPVSALAATSHILRTRLRRVPLPVSQSALPTLEDLDPQAAEARRAAAHVDLLDFKQESIETTQLRDELARWHRLPGEPWAPPQNLSAASIDELTNEPNVYVDAATNLMAFGHYAPRPPVVENLENGSRRLQAFNAICSSQKFNLIRVGEIVCIPEDVPQSLWSETRIRESSAFITWLSAALLRHAKPEARSGAKRGPKFKYTWEEGELRFDQLMAERGDLDDSWPEWSAQADIEREILKHMKKHGGGEPSSSQVQEYVSMWLKRFRSTAN